MMVSIVLSSMLFDFISILGKKNRFPGVY
jgi:hypothetical protein